MNDSGDESQGPERQTQEDMPPEIQAALEDELRRLRPILEISVMEEDEDLDEDAVKF